jgi:hypothetical protein
MSGDGKEKRASSARYAFNIYRYAGFVKCMQRGAGMLAQGLLPRLEVGLLTPPVASLRVHENCA